MRDKCTGNQFSIFAFKNARFRAPVLRLTLSVFQQPTHILYMNFAHMPCKGGISRKNVVNLRAKY